MWTTCVSDQQFRFQVTLDGEPTCFLSPFSTFLVMAVDEQAIDVVLAAGHGLAFLSIFFFHDRAIESMSDGAK